MSYVEVPGAKVPIRMWTDPGSVEDVAMQQLRNEFIHDELIMNGHPVTRNDVIATQESHTDAVPDFTWRVKDLAIDGDRVAARLFNKGTPAKEWFGVPPHRRHGRVCRVRLPQGS